MPHRIFISYRRDDAQGHARALHEFLNQRFTPGTVFFDRDRGSISEGDDFSLRIQAALAEAEVVLVLIGKAWLQASDIQGRQRLQLPEDIVRQEIESALQAGKLVIPVLFDGAAAPHGEQLPPGLADLTRREAFALGGKTEEYQQCRERLAQFVEQQPGLQLACRRYQMKLPHERQLREIQRHYLGRGQARPAFVGREAQLLALDEWLADDRGAPRLLLTGAAAMGKSSLILHWLQDPCADKLGWAVVFLPISVRFGTSTPDMFWSMAATRLARLAGLVFEVPRAQVADAYLDISLDALDQLAQQDRKVLFVIDGLDEAAGWAIDPRLLGTSHAGTRWLVSARGVGAQSQPVERWLQTLGWRRGRSTQVLELVPLSRAAVVQAVTDCLAHTGEPRAALTLADDVWRASAGDPMLLGYYLDDLANMPQASLALARKSLEGIEPGFASYFNQWVNLQRPYWQDAEGRSELFDGLLVLLCCAHGPVPIAGIEYLLNQAFGVTTPISAARLRGLQRFVIETADGLVLAHPRLQEHLLQEFPEEGRWVQRGRQAYLAWGRSVAVPGIGERYLARHYALHLADPRSKVQPSDIMHLASASWARLSLREDDTGRQLALDLEIARRELEARAQASDPLQAWRWSIFLMRTSIKTRARVEPELLAAYVQHGLLGSEHALRRLDLMAPRERACGLALLAHRVPAQDRQPLLEHALAAAQAIGDFKERMASWARVLAAMPPAPEREQAQDALLHALNEAGTMYHWLEAVDVVASSLSLHGQEKLLHWCFRQVDSADDWHCLDAFMPHLQPELRDQAVALALSRSSELAGHQAAPPQRRNEAASNRAARIADAGLPYVFACLTPAERDSCWQRVHATTQLDKYQSHRISGLCLVLPWLQACGREDEARTQLTRFHADYNNEYVKAETLTRFARATAGSDIANLARQLAVDTLLKMTSGESLQTRYLGQAADVLDVASVDRCFDALVQSSAPGRWRALAQLASRLSTQQLQQVRAMQRHIGDEADARLALCSLRLRNGSATDPQALAGDLDALRRACPEAAPAAARIDLLDQIDKSRWDEVFGPNLAWLAGGNDALLLARPGSTPPEALWAAIKRRSNFFFGSWVYATVEHRHLLGNVMPAGQLARALELMVDDGHYADVLQVIDDLPADLAAALHARMAKLIRTGHRLSVKRFPGACLLAAQGPVQEREAWHAWARAALSDADADDPQYTVWLLPLCGELERKVQLSLIRQRCEDHYDLGLNALRLLMPKLVAHEAAAFLDLWLRAVRKKCAEQPDWLADVRQVPAPFAHATLLAFEELLAHADRSAVLRTFATWAVPVGIIVGGSGLTALIEGVQAATEAFD